MKRSKSSRRGRWFTRWGPQVAFRELTPASPAKAMPLTQVVLYPISVLVIANIVTCSMILLANILDAIVFAFDTGFEPYSPHPLGIASAIALPASIAALLVLRRLFKRFVICG